MRAFAGCRFQHAGTQALTAHFHQTETRDPANLNSCSVVFERVLHRSFDFADVGIVFHVDEVDHYKTGHVAQP